MRLINEVKRDDLIAAATLVRNVQIRASSPRLLAELEELYEGLRRGERKLDLTREAVRKLLRNGKYRPSGRGKPAQEYLLRVFEENGKLDLINNAADVNNLVSLRSGLPISAFDADKLSGEVTLRLGREGESYPFNAAGQVLECRDLLVVCDERGPVGSPVKDSQATKVFPGAASVLYVTYANRDLTTEEELLAVAGELGRELALECEGAGADEPMMFERAVQVGESSRA